MRYSISIIIAILLMACSESPSPLVTLEVGKVSRVNECHVLLDGALLQETSRITHLHYACGVPESALHEKNWWGSQPQPLAFSMYVGDCLLLNEKLFCVQEIIPGESASLEATYTVKNKGSLFQRIR